MKFPSVSGFWARRQAVAGKMLMKRLITALCLAAISAPAFAQAPPDDVRAFLATYVAAFNKADAAALANDIYATPGVSGADTQAKLAAQYAQAARR